ncbi:HugZ family protein [Pseudooctadecabacter sp.]|uniref:HugZ family pyridoxamine 5'-phosphate oxidase n=1 Tax=Pseudooctadecabacter sp. TaxID=1966338 RepID=UPI0035C846C0
MTNPIRPTDDDARALAMQLLREARHGALGVIDPTLGGPLVTRVACAWIGDALHLLVSDLSAHTAALTADPNCSILIAGPDAKGDPLTHPRLTLQCTAQMADKAQLRGAWLMSHPKSKLYIDFTDFRMMRLVPKIANLNGGFGKAYQLTTDDLKHEGDA